MPTPAALALAQLAEEASPSPSPDVAPALACLAAWCEGRATDAERDAFGDRLHGATYQRDLESVQLDATCFAACCALHVGRRATTNLWRDAQATAGWAVEALEQTTHPDAVGLVARALRRYLVCPSAERLAVAFVDENFSLP